ncbi:tRNA(Ile)-lysidine synthetase-like protein [Candidatus Koribacter versatilis Ellin345]|uniref:tRNA(Ile)-lysidine synthase n=1 Tax=Koribacter versatilis (strain Ellin345) TaxID=204669 RepID=Q1IVN3_KORVE|nr:tRNA lysidine(34) synthetase TilS [Candidatus Koribacter versatilis]ABF39067.1 tRNA(Ile)-lysidine synthetase-like protein [Candidatus Koribacter versatilis Ellin345]
MLPSLKSYIRTHALFRPGDRVGVAVSGGADSVALLRGLLELRSELGIALSVVHLHHGIRGAEADADEQFVADLAGQFDLSLHLERVDVPSHSSQEKLSLETAARDLRYAFFRRLLESSACDKVATAHTLDDQAETVLLRILRGTGTRGLAAIPPFRDASPELAACIVRPLLGTERTEVETYLKSLNQPWREDSTNTDPKHLRNRIRHELLPMLEAEYNPALRQSLANLAEIARAEEEYWGPIVERHFDQIVTMTNFGAVLDRSRLSELPQAFRRRVLLALHDRLDMPVSFDGVDFELDFIEGNQKGHITHAQASIQVTSDQVSFFLRDLTKDGPAAPVLFDQPLSIPTTLTLPTSTTLRTTFIPASNAPRYNPHNLLAHDRLQLPLRVRNWQPGDRYWPAGSKQPEKLKRLFAEHHISADARLTWPVVLSGETIVWVKDFPVAQGFQAEQQDAVLIEAVETRQV